MSLIRGTGRAVLTLDQRRRSADPRFDIVSVTDGGAGDALVTTAAPHRLTGGAGELIWVTALPTYDTYFSGDGTVGSAFEVVSETTFKLLGSYNLDAGAGTWFEITRTAHNIVTIADDGFGNPRMTTAAAHGLAFGSRIVVSGNSEPTNNVTWPNPEGPDTPYTIILSTPGGDPWPFGRGGRWDWMSDAIVSFRDDADVPGTLVMTTGQPHGIDTPRYIVISGTDLGQYDGLYVAEPMPVADPIRVKFGNPAYSGDLEATGRWFVPGGSVVNFADDGSGNLVITVADGHGITSAGFIVEFAGTALYNGRFTIDDLPSSNQMISFGAFVGEDSGGTWAVPYP